MQGQMARIFLFRNSLKVRLTGGWPTLLKSNSYNMPTEDAPPFPMFEGWAAMLSTPGDFDSDGRRGLFSLPTPSLTMVPRPCAFCRGGNSMLPTATDFSTIG